MFLGYYTNGRVLSEIESFVTNVRMSQVYSDKWQGTLTKYQMKIINVGHCVCRMFSSFSDELTGINATNLYNKNNASLVGVCPGTTAQKILTDADSNTCMQVKQGVTQLRLQQDSNPNKELSPYLVTVVTKGEWKCSDGFHVHVSTSCPQSCPSLLRCDMIDNKEVSSGHHKCRWDENAFTSYVDITFPLV